jgi:hypothetical protein
LYQIDVTDGDRADDHRNDNGEVWVCEHEVTPRFADARPASDD